MGTALEMMVNAARWKVGPFNYTAALRLDNVGYDSDIYYGSTPNPVPDYTFTAGPEVHIFLPLKKRVVFDIYELPQYVFYLHTNQERTLNNAFRGLVHFVFDRFYIEAGGGLTDAKQRWSTELSIPVRLKQNDVTGMVLWQASKSTSFALQYRRSTYNYEDQASGISGIAESLNRTESYVDCTAYLQQRGRLRFYLNGEYGSYIFSEAVSSFKNSRSYSAYGGVDFLPPEGGYDGETSGIRGRINLGYKYFDILDPQQKDFSGLAGDTRASIGIIKLTAIQGFFSKGPQFSVYSGLSYYLQTVYGVGLVRSLTRKILFTYDYSYNRNNYPSGVTVGGILQAGSIDHYTTHSFRMNFRLRRDLRLDLMASLSNRNSKLAIRPVSEHNFFGFSLIYGYSSGGLSMPAGPIF